MVGGMIRVDPVYTPAHLRGHGYASAATVEVSKAALAAGATDVVLFTDPANHTSNASTSESDTCRSLTSPGTALPTTHHQ